MHTVAGCESVSLEYFCASSNVLYAAMRCLLLWFSLRPHKIDDGWYYTYLWKDLLHEIFRFEPD